jgi:penicillin-binding protein 1C
VKTGKVLAYAGNTKSADEEHGSDVDCINAPRSTGSILKPFLYEKCMEDGMITPAMLVPDIPTQFGSFSPKNFSTSYDGAVPVNKALARSLNIPMVRLLNEYGLEKFHRDLKQAGLTTLNKPAKYYGLSLILGGAEAKLWDLNTAYVHLAQTLRYNEIKPVVLTQTHQRTTNSQPRTKKTINTQRSTPDRACIYKTFEAMVDVNRPDEDGNWRAFASSQKIAWKTGTSFGFRDAWAIGVTPDFVVGVWIGNADGEGRPGLTGIKAAAPLLFDVFAQLPKSQSWFIQPVNEMVRVPICRESGHRASDLCEKADTVPIPKTCLNTTACPYHQIVHLSRNGKYRVDSECESVYNMKNVSWFVLPPLVEKYYKFNHPNYRGLPDFKPECFSKVSDRAIALLYPKPNSKIYVPVEIDGNSGRTVFEATHRNVSTKVYWHLDDNFIGETTEIHQMALNPGIGKHKLMLVDENGISVTIKFEALGKDLN